jgi:hypothetical protein
MKFHHVTVFLVRNTRKNVYSRVCSRSFYLIRTRNLHSFGMLVLDIKVKVIYSVGFALPPSSFYSSKNICTFLKICSDAKIQNSTLVLSPLSLSPHKFARPSCECYGLYIRCEVRMTPSAWSSGMVKKCFTIFRIGCFIAVFTVACRSVCLGPTGSNPSLSH